MPHILLVTGALACFRRPDIECDAVTYDAITPVAARRLFETVHWTPAIRWRVERIDVLHPIRTEWRAMEEGRILHLVDVRYALHARFELTGEGAAQEHPGRHAEMFRRRARQGSFARPPILGRRGLAAELALGEAADLPPSAYRGSGTIDLGWMIHDRRSTDVEGYRFYRPLMIDGIIDCGAIPPERLAD